MLLKRKATKNAFMLEKGCILYKTFTLFTERKQIIIKKVFKFAIYMKCRENHMMFSQTNKMSNIILL